VVYSAYGNDHEIVIQGRVQEEQSFKQANVADSWLQNLWRRLKDIKPKDIEDKLVTVYIDGLSFATKSDSEGYFSFDINTTAALKSGYKEIFIATQGNRDRQRTKVLIITQPLIAVLADFDDTLILSNVTNKWILGINTMFKNYKQRKAVSGMADWFKEILAKNPSNTPSPLFILSGSPQQLFRPIEAFLNYHHFPKHTLLLKKAHGEHKDPLLNQFVYKVKKIEKLFKLYPQNKWYMFGDSGERDREVYSYLKAKYPKKIINFFIRDIKSGKVDTNR